MSYEGYNEYLCPEGHRWNMDCESENLSCPTCGQEQVWSNSVDNTNCYLDGAIPEEVWKQFEIEPEIEETCNLGHKHVVKSAKYRIPTDNEKAKMRHKYDSETETYIPLRGIN